MKIKYVTLSSERIHSIKIGNTICINKPCENWPLTGKEELEEEIISLIKELPYQELQMIIALAKGFLKKSNKIEDIHIKPQ